MTVPNRHSLKSPGPSSRSRRLYAHGGLVARVGWYPPGQRMARHAHERHQVSLLLGGSLGETVCREERRLRGPALGVKPAGVAHANDYGPDGALILCIELDAGFDLFDDAGLPERWQWRGASDAALPQARSLLRALVDGAPIDAEGRLWEWLAGVGRNEDTPATATPPRWLQQACERLQEEDLPLARLAGELGLHPVYVARAFVRSVGCTPSTFRARARFQRALIALSQGRDLAETALSVGFADQAHFCRAARACSGLSPGQLRTLLGGRASSDSGP